MKSLDSLKKFGPECNAIGAIPAATGKPSNRFRSAMISRAIGLLTALAVTIAVIDLFLSPGALLAETRQGHSNSHSSSVVAAPKNGATKAGGARITPHAAVVTEALPAAAANEVPASKKKAPIGGQCSSSIGEKSSSSIKASLVSRSATSRGQTEQPFPNARSSAGTPSKNLAKDTSETSGEDSETPDEVAGVYNSDSVGGASQSGASAQVDLEQPAPPQQVAPLFVDYRRGALPQIGFVPETFLEEGGKAYVLDQYGNKVYFTIDPWLQKGATRLLNQFRIPWGAIVVLEPKTGKLLAIAGHSSRNPEADSTIPFRATYPAASLIKMITGAAAVETTGLRENDQIVFRGGNYTLGEGNFRPDARKDRRTMTVGEAMGKSVNPVFGRIALTKLSAEILSRYAGAFNFNAPIPLEVAVEPSRFTHPPDDYELSRTGAGFGQVILSPLHAAMIGGSLANHGVMMKPYLISEIAKSDGRVIYSPRPAELRRPVKPGTAEETLKMMTHTITEGTAKRHFTSSKLGPLRGVTIAAKTGTLKGDNPVGLYRWFVATAPVENPKVTVAALVVDMGGARIHGTGLGRLMLDYYFTEDRKSVPQIKVPSQEPRGSKRKSSVGRKRSSAATSRKTRSK